MSTNTQYSLTLCGHSFIRRLKNQKLGGDNKDVSLSDPLLSENFAVALQLNDKFGHVATLSKGVVFITDLLDKFKGSFFAKTRPFFVDLGSNDLANFHKSNNLQATQLADDLCDIMLTLVPSVTLINSVIPRTRGLASSPEAFFENARAFNTRLRERAANNYFLFANKMKGFFYEEGGRDLHPSPDSKYWNRVRLAIMSVTGKVHKV